MPSYAHIQEAHGASQAEIEKIIASYGYTIKRQLSGGHMNLIYLVEHDAEILVIKVVDHQQKIESTVYTIFSEDAITPTLFRHIEHTPDIHLLVLEYIDNSVDGRSYIKQNPYETETFARTMARYISIIHSKIPSDVDSDFWYPVIQPDAKVLSQCLQLETLRFVTNCLDTYPLLNETYVKTLNHGDFTTKNMLVSSEKVLVIDLGVMRISPYIDDIALCLWYVEYHHAEISERFIRAFLQEYQKYTDRRISSKDLVTAIVYRIAGIITEFAHYPEYVQTWAERLDWTFCKHQKEELFMFVADF